MDDVAYRAMPRALTHRLWLQYVRLLPPPLDLEHWWKRLAPTAGQRWRRAFAMLCFAAGVTIIGWFSASMWSDHWARAGIAFRAVEAEAAEQPYGCNYPDCAACLTEIDAYRDGLVFTGGSGGAYGFDLPTIAKLSNRKTANCIIYGTTLDGFPLILNRRNKLSPQQILLHALNTWVMIHGGHYLSGYDLPDADFVYFRRPEQRREPAASMKWNLYPLLLQRHFSELQVRWRHAIWLYRTGHALQVALLPLSVQAHIARKDHLMQRWIKISPWAASFLQKVDVVPSYDAIRERLARIRQRLPPTTRTILFNMPEYAPITQAQREPIYREAKERFLTVLKELGIEYIDLDYEACGLRREDFWKPGPFALDPVHPHENSKGMITDCFLKELKKHDVFR